jgi:hypothetical protein
MRRLQTGRHMFGLPESQGAFTGSDPEGFLHDQRFPIK